MTQNFKPQNMPTLIPYLTVSQAEESIRFYEKAFGFKLTNPPAKNDKGQISHVEMSYLDIQIMFTPEGVWDSIHKTPNNLGIIMPISLYLYTPDVDKLYEQALAHGAISIREPADEFWGDRFCQLKDIDGYLWSFATHVNKA